MISCDGCGGKISEPLDRHTYTVEIRGRTDKWGSKVLVGPLQICGDCLKTLQHALTKATDKCLLGRR